MTSDGFIARCGMDEAGVREIQELALICAQADGVDIKFNYGMIQNRKPEVLSDFCWYRQGKLIGYVPLDQFGSKGEITGAVHPEHRRQHIFSHLYAEAVAQSHRLECRDLLLVSYRGSSSGTETVKTLGVKYFESEYCMRASLAELRKVDGIEVEIREVHLHQEEEILSLSRMLSINFPAASWGSREDLIKELNDPDKRYWLAYRRGEVIGHIGISSGGDRESYIRGVGIVPEWRRQGLGRQMLGALLDLLVADGASDMFELDVATENEGALNIYIACGFRQSNVYDYYRVE